MIAKYLKLLKAQNINLLLGVELEFYSNTPPHSTTEIQIKNEIGENQFEAIFPVSENTMQVLKNIILFRNKFQNTCNFEGHLSKDQPNSGLQFNFSIWKEGKNLLENFEFRNAVIFFLLEALKTNISAFIKNENCLLRLTNYEKIFKFRNSPYNISCGGQYNRTTAIRLIEEMSDKYSLKGFPIKGFRIEHRVSSSCASVLKSFESILQSILHAVENKKQLETIEILHSNAFEKEIIKQFCLQPLI